MNSKSINEIVTLVFKAVALGMGVCVVTLSALGTVEPKTAVSLLGLGLAALAITTLQKG